MSSIKRNIGRLPGQYLSALRKYIKRGTPASLRPARRLGDRAVALGLGTLDLARIHGRSLAALEQSSRKKMMFRRAENFFTKACPPVMEAQLGGPATELAVGRLRVMTSQRAAELESANRQLRQGITRRKHKENNSLQDHKHQDLCLGKALKLQKELRHGSHQVLTAQEEERKKVSQELQNEVAQTLLGINVRLLALRQKARRNPKGLKNEIASTRSLVVKSAKAVRRFAQELDNHPEGQDHRPDKAPSGGQAPGSPAFAARARRRHKTA